MSVTTCEPCCNPTEMARSVDSYRTAQLIILCEILDAIAGPTEACCSTFDAALPATGIAAGFSDGTLMQTARVFDGDTGAGTQNILGNILRISANGGSIEAKGQQVMASSIPIVLASDQTWVGATNLGKAEDAAHASGDVGVAAWGVRNDALATTFGTNGDYCPISTSAVGALFAAGDVASDGVDTGFPMKIGGQARTTNPTAVADADRVNAMSDKVGRFVTTPCQVRQLVSSQTTTISASTAETTIITSVASTFLDLTALTISNTSATGVRVDLRDATAGSVIASLYVPPTDVRGIVFQVPLPQTSAANNWTLQSSASVTDLRVFAQFIKNV